VSPTQRSLKLLRDRGYRAAVVEKWNPHARRRIDLFGIIDLVAIGNGETIGVQTTSGSNVASRIDKITESEAIADLRDAGWRIVVHGWRKLKSGWACREVDVS
jgi:hypothetical protein